MHCTCCTGGARGAWKIKLLCREFSWAHFVYKGVCVWVKQIAIKVLHNFVMKLKDEFLSQVQYTSADNSWFVPQYFWLLKAYSDQIFTDNFWWLVLRLVFPLEYFFFSARQFHFHSLSFSLASFSNDEFTINLKKVFLKLVLCLFSSVFSFTYGAGHFSCVNDSTEWSLVTTNPNSTWSFNVW